ncbi:hypothetical protein CspeluHIS016_0601500 [Cutaneotrichosporon spelunceum]|uniref:Uncharacterized protein n=1 Tax=Cutaneotrichosporon spelunceum TaxID=1672016 RepID=A0AAD3TXH3_9TREE|nr:hypothetical protein CspeluHIS016_0601500 [Cutaneotrichosporon spelunceum]
MQEPELQPTYIPATTSAGGVQITSPFPQVPLPLTDNAEALLDAVFAVVIESMRSEAPAYTRTQLEQLGPRLAALTSHIVLRLSAATLAAWAHDCKLRMYNYLPTQLVGALEGHEAQYRVTLGPYALGIVRVFMQGGAASADDISCVIAGVGNTFREMREAEGPALADFITALAGGELEALVQESSNATADGTDPHIFVEILENEMCAAGHEATRQVLWGLPRIKSGVAHRVLGEAQLSPGLA